MELSEILTAISTVGFPIVMCVIIFYQNEKTIETLRETINNNTNVVKELIARFDVFMNMSIKNNESED